nr:hypothetical protein [Nitrospirota bacterium]
MRNSMRDLSSSFLILAFCWALAIPMPAQAEEPSSSTANASSSSAKLPELFANNGEHYNGGRGLITLSGPTGMFLNPTSGTMAKGSFTAQAFVTVIKPLPNKDQFPWYNALASYGVTDWLEVGAIGTFVDRSNRVGTENVNHSVMAGGGFVRLRVLKDEGYLPETSLGFTSLNGDDLVARQTLFLATSKRFAINEQGFFKAFRVHMGGRQYWQTPGSDMSFKTWRFIAQRGPNDTIGYAGGELSLPNNIYLIGETQTMESGGRYMPWSAGIQARLDNGFGLSFSILQPGYSSSVTAYIGIGINFM